MTKVSIGSFTTSSGPWVSVHMEKNSALLLAEHIIRSARTGDLNTGRPEFPATLQEAGDTEPTNVRFTMFINKEDKE